jgi:hypothetical protein
MLVIRRLRPVVSVLPAALEKGFGRRRQYMLGQVRQTITQAGVSASLLPVAAAAFCSFEEFRKLDTTLTRDDYAALREMLASHFGLDAADLSPATLLEKRVG